MLKIVKTFLAAIYIIYIHSLIIYMKQLRKNEQGLFICEECHQLFHKTDKLSYHINKKHISSQYYFNKWLKENDDDKCKICNKDTKFYNITFGYIKTCCKKHKYELNKIKFKERCLKHFGVEYPSQNEKIAEKSKQTKKEKYGDENYNNRKKCIKTCLIKYGVENPFQSEKCKQKIKKTCLKKYKSENNMQSEKGKEEYTLSMRKKYNVDYPFQSLQIRKKSKNTMIEKYGVQYPSQNTNIFQKIQKNCFYSKKYKDTNIYYRGSYELDFLEKYYDKYPDIINAKSIKYMFNNKQHYYFPDFYIPSLNLIIECKNSYLAEKDKEKIEEKKKASIANGFNYIMIIDKKYEVIL